MFFLCKDSNYASMVGCSNLKLYDHQLLPAKYLLQQKLNNGTRHSKKIMLYFEMGSGKSATLAESIALLSSHLRLALIVVPPAVVSSMINELKSCPWAGIGEVEVGPGWDEGRLRSAWAGMRGRVRPGLG